MQTTACGGNSSGEEAAVDEHAKLKANREDAQNITRDPRNTFSIANHVFLAFYSRTQRISGYFYAELYSLAGDVLELLETKRLEYFPRLPALQKEMSNTIHIIGKLIANN